jgi:hypothetical protein
VYSVEADAGDAASSSARLSNKAIADLNVHFFRFMDIPLLKNAVYSQYVRTGLPDFVANLKVCLTEA